MSGYLPWKKRNPEEQQGVFSTFAEALYDKQQAVKPEFRGIQSRQGMEVRQQSLSPATLILTEYDFDFLQSCGISTKGMILGQWR